MDVESSDMLTALRRQIQPHLLMTALTPTHIPTAGHPSPPAAQHFQLALPNYIIHVS